MCYVPQTFEPLVIWSATPSSRSLVPIDHPYQQLAAKMIYNAEKIMAAAAAIKREYLQQPVQRAVPAAAMWMPDMAQVVSWERMCLPMLSAIQQQSILSCWARSCAHHLLNCRQTFACVCSSRSHNVSFHLDTGVSMLAEVPESVMEPPVSGHDVAMRTFHQNCWKYWTTNKTTIVQSSGDVLHPRLT